MRHGTHNDPVKPKGMPRRKGMRADRATIRGDLTPVKAEAAMWLNPTNRYR
jgi:hypothetical protein